jgi:selenoprotein W-related protein
LTSQVLTALKNKIREFTLVPGTGGCFEIQVNGETLYSKLKTGQFPDENWVVEQLKKRAGL